VSSIPPALRKPFYFVLIATAMTVIFYVTFYNVNRQWKPLPLQPAPVVWMQCDSPAPAALNMVYSPLWRKGCDEPDARRDFTPPFWVRYRGPNDSAALRRLDIQIKQGLDEAYDLPMRRADTLDFALLSFRVVFGVRRWLPYFDEQQGAAWLVWNPTVDQDSSVMRAAGAGWRAVRIAVDSTLTIYLVKDARPFSGRRLPEWQRRLATARWHTPSNWTVMMPSLTARAQKTISNPRVHTEYQALIELSAYYQPFTVRGELKRLRESMETIDTFGTGALLMMADGRGKVAAVLRLGRIDRWRP